jgi:hypothetical protein
MRGGAVNIVKGVGRGKSKSNGSGNPKIAAPLAKSGGGGSNKPIPAKTKVVGK